MKIENAMVTQSCLIVQTVSVKCKVLETMTYISHYLWLTNWLYPYLGKAMLFFNVFRKA